MWVATQWTPVTDRQKLSCFWTFTCRVKTSKLTCLETGTKVAISILWNFWRYRAGYNLRREKSTAKTCHHRLHPWGWYFLLDNLCNVEKSYNSRRPSYNSRRPTGTFWKLTGIWEHVQSWHHDSAGLSPTSFWHEEHIICWKLWLQGCPAELWYRNPNTKFQKCSWGQPQEFGHLKLHCPGLSTCTQLCHRGAGR